MPKLSEWNRGPIIKWSCYQGPLEFVSSNLQASKKNPFFCFQKPSLKIRTPSAISWNSYSLFRNCYFHFSIGCLIELKFREVWRNIFSNRWWKFQFSILWNKNVLFLKKYDLGHSQYRKKSFVYWPNFQRRFWCYPLKVQKSSLVKNDVNIFSENLTQSLSQVKYTMPTWSSGPCKDLSRITIRPCKDNVDS